MSVKPICVVRGTGSIGQRHLSILQKSGAVYPVAFPVRPQRRAELKEKGFEVICEWREALDAGARCAIIASDTSRHQRDVLDAGETGLNLLVEKPMTPDANSADSCLQAIRSLDRQVWVGCYYRFHKALNNVRENLIRLGRINSVRIECQSYLPAWRPDRPYRESYSARPDEGGVLRDLIHEIDYACWLFGWPESVQAKIQATGQLGICSEDTADMLWETGNGTMISIRLDYLSQPARRYLKAYGEHGSIEWDGFCGTVKLELVGKDTDSQVFAQERDEIILAQDMAFINSGGGQSDPRLATGADGVRALAICDAAREASRLRQEVKVNYFK